MGRRSRTDERTEESTQRDPLPVRPQEQLLFRCIEEFQPRRALCNSAGRGQFAIAAAIAWPQATVDCYFWDLYQVQRAGAFFSEESPLPSNLAWRCETDFLETPVDFAAISCSRRGDAEFTRELLQTAHCRLELDGQFVASVDHPDDEWLHTELRKLFTKVTRRRDREGTLYLAKKTAPLRKIKSFDCEFAFREGERLLFTKSRPGVFSHRRVDGGARALINTAVIGPQDRVLDLGCGSGVVGVAAAVRAPQGSALAVDSNPRATQCAQWAAARNELPNLSAALDCDGSNVPAGEFSLVLANPPYFSNYRIAELFLQTAHRALQPGGTLQLVTKAPAWFLERIPELYHDVTEQLVRDYTVLAGRK